MPRRRPTTPLRQGRHARIAGCVLLASALVLSSGACSRLSFVRTDASRGDFERVARDVDVRERSPRTGVAFGQVQLARQHLQAGRVQEAEKLVREAVRSDPRSADAHTVLALVLDRTGRSSEAGPHYRRAIELLPGRGEVLNNYGVWLCGQGRFAESLSWFDRAAAAPGYATVSMALANAGRCARRAGQPDRAERDLRRSITLDAENPVALGELADVAYQAGRMLEARAFIERRLAAAPADAHSLQLASQIETKLGDSDAARRYRERQQKEFPATGDSRSPGKDHR